MRLIASGFVAVGVTYSAAALDRSPAVILGGIMIAMAVMEACDINLGQATNQRLIAAAEKMAAAGRVPDAEIEQLGREFAQEASRADCAAARANMSATVADLLRQAEAK